jgi:beta-glucanase (GH16 family)
MKNQQFKNQLKLVWPLFILLFFQMCIYPQTNLIIDSDFENGSSSWTIWGGASRVTTDIKSGTYAVRAIANSGVNQTITGLLPNTTYILTAWLKSSNNLPVSLGVKKYGGNELVVQTSSSSYVQLSIQFTTGPVTTTAVIYGYNPAGTNTIMSVDDMVLISTTETPYQLVWSDEFNGNGEVDSTNWTFENGFVRNEEVQWYQSENATQQGGNLIIEGRKENLINTRLNPNYFAGSTDWKKSRQYINYTSSSLKTVGKHSWLYGRFEIRAKITNQTGTWPAIWTLGNNCEWPSNGEVDIMENYGGNILANFAWGTNTRWSAKWDSVKQNVINTFISNEPDWLNKFHIWTLDWDENKMSIYLDDSLINEINLSATLNGNANCAADNPFKKKHYLLVNLAMGSSGGSVANLSFPTQYLIDYVRVFQLKENLSVINETKKGAFNVYPNPVTNMLTIKCLYDKPHFKIYNGLGKLVLKGMDSKVDLSEFKKGVYFIKVEDFDAIKIIKE